MSCVGIATAEKPVTKLMFGVGAFLSWADIVNQEEEAPALSGVDNEVNKQRKALIKWAAGHLPSKIAYSTELQKSISFTVSDLRHSLSRHTGDAMVEMKVIKQLPGLLSNAHYTTFDKSHEPTPDKIGMHNFVNVTSIDNDVYAVWMKVREDKRGKLFYYDHGIIKEKR